MALMQTPRHADNESHYFRLRSCAATVPHIRAGPEEIQSRRWPLDTIYPACTTGRCTQFSRANYCTVSIELCIHFHITNLCSALQLHPNVPSLYVIAASHELSHTSPSTARTLLQRGLRLNSGSIELWREYIRMELHFIEGMRRRWNVLGISLDEGGRRTNQRMEIDVDMNGTDDPIIIDDIEERPPDEIVAAEHGGDEGDAARRAIMEGAIVKSAMSNAAKGMLDSKIVQMKDSLVFEAIPRIQLFSQLENLIRTQPCQHSLRANLINELYSLLQKTIPGDSEAIKMQATRPLRELVPETENDDSEANGSENERLVDGIQYANEQLVRAIKNPPNDNARHQIPVIYADFVKEWCQLSTLNPTLVKRHSFPAMNLVADSYPSRNNICYLLCGEWLNSRALYPSCRRHIYAFLCMMAGLPRWPSNSRENILLRRTLLKFG